MHPSGQPGGPEDAHHPGEADRPGGVAPAGWRDATRVVHAGEPAATPGAPFRAGPVLAAPYHLAAEGPGGADAYGRTDNPTVRALEQAIGELEGGKVVAFGSGMAAITGLLLATLAPGDTVLLPSDGYFKVREFADTVLTERGVTVHTVPTPGPYRLAELAPTLVLLETPANPGLAVCDVAAVAAMSREFGAVLAVDNTTATPLGQRPLALGADVVVASGTKALTGHSDLVLGYVATADPGLADRLRGWRAMTGAICGPFEAWLAHRSLATLELRLARQEANAAAVVEFLAGRSEVTGLRWPGLDPLARRQLTRMPGLVTFELADEAAATAFLRATRLVANATSFGGLHSSADRRAQFGDPVPAGLIRLSVGCEDPVDLIDDLRAGLAAG